MGGHTPQSINCRRPPSAPESVSACRRCCRCRCCCCRSEVFLFLPVRILRTSYVPDMYPCRLGYLVLSFNTAVFYRSCVPGIPAFPYAALTCVQQRYRIRSIVRNSACAYHPNPSYRSSSSSSRRLRRYYLLQFYLVQQRTVTASRGDAKALRLGKKEHRGRHLLH